MRITLHEWREVNWARLSPSFLHVVFFSLPGATTDNLPPGVLYKVKASYKYQAEDADELNFEVGEVINVITYEDPEEQVRTCKECASLEI